MTKQALVMIGLPGAGKSTIVHTQYADFLKSAILLDPDKIKEEKPDYNPKKPWVYHTWSKQEAEKRFLQAITDGKNIILDGTGTNVPKMYNRIKYLQSQGYYVKLIYVVVSLQTAIKRNNSRDRVVPEYIIREKYEVIDTSFLILSDVADESIKIKND